MKGEFILREVAGETLLIPVGETALKMNGMITLDPVAAEIWKLLQQNADRAAILGNILSRFDVDEATAGKDLDEFLTQMRENGLLEDDG